MIAITTSNSMSVKPERLNMEHISFREEGQGLQRSHRGPRTRPPA